MSADNGIYIVENEDSTYSVNEYFASVDDSYHVIGKFDNLKEAIEFANNQDTEYGIRFQFQEPWKKNLAGTDLMMDWIQDILEKNFPGEMADGLTRMNDDRLRIRSISSNVEFILQLWRIK